MAIVIGRRGSLQFGSQSAFGTPGTAFFETFGTGSNFTPEKTRWTGEDMEGGGGIAATYIEGLRTGNRFALTRNTVLDIDTIDIELASIFGVVAAPTQDASSNAYTRTHEWDSKVNVEPQLVTVRCVERDGSPTPGIYQVQASDLICESMQISYAEGSVPTMSSTWRGHRTVYGGAYTAGTLIQPRTIPTALARVSIDDTWAAMIGGTPALKTQIKNAQLTINSGLVYPMVEQGQTDLGYAVAPERGKMSADLTITALFDTAAAGLIREEYVHAEAEDIRFVNLIFNTGIEIDSPASTETYAFEVGGAFRHQETSLTERSNRDGEGLMQMDMVFRTVFDPTSGHDIYCKLVNGQSSWLTT